MKLSPPLQQPKIEALPLVGSRALTVSRFKKRCVDFHWHYHPEYELIAIEKGQGICYIGSAVMPYQAGDWFLIGANLPHSFGSYEEQRSGAEWSVLHFLPTLFGGGFWEMPQNKESSQLLNESRKGLCFRFKQATAVKKILKEMTEAPHQNICLPKFLELLVRLTECESRRVLNHRLLMDSPFAHSRLDKILSYIHLHSHDLDLKQASVARHAGLSPAAFCQLFKQGTGKAYTTYLHELRIAKACSEILHTNKSVSAIAMDVGFNNLSNFHRRFVKITGQSPLKYRRTQGGVHTAIP